MRRASFEREIWVKAVDSAYGLVEKIGFGNAFYRHDIGAKALAAMED